MPYRRTLVHIVLSCSFILALFAPSVQQTVNAEDVGAADRLQEFATLLLDEGEDLASGVLHEARSSFKSAIDCPADIDGEVPSRTVLQVINNVFCKWSEYDIGANGDFCIVMEAPVQRRLTSEESGLLLALSSEWMDQVLPAHSEWQVVEPTDVRTGLPSNLPMLASPSMDSSAAATNADSNASGRIRPASATVWGSTIDASISQVVIGTDDRSRVSLSTIQTFPWNTVGFVVITCPNDQMYRGTGFLVAPHTILTVGHNIYDEDNGGFVEALWFAPAQYQSTESGNITLPYGWRDAVEVATNQQYIDVWQSQYSYEMVQYDYAAAFIEEPFSGITTYMPLAFDITPVVDSTVIDTAGYPASVKGEDYSEAQWSTSGTVVDYDARVLSHDADVTGGQSGSPTWIEDLGTGAPRTIAFVSFSSESYNGGPRLVAANQSLIEEWMQWNPYCTVSTPEPPSGPTSGIMGTAYSYSTGGSTSDEEHSVEYRFDWGDATVSSWSTATSASKSWPSTGTYEVKAQARCASEPLSVSPWSSALSVTISPPPTPEISVSPGSFTFSLPVGGNGDDTLHISNLGDGALTYAVSLSYAGAWLAVSPGSGPVAPDSAEDLTVSVDTTGLLAGNYQANIEVDSNDPVRSQLIVPVTLVVKPPPEVTTVTATAISQEGATLHGTLDDDGEQECEAWFAYGTSSGGPYPYTTTPDSAVTAGEDFDHTVSGLLSGTAYHYRAQASNESGAASGSELVFTTLPSAPSLTAAADGAYGIDLSWTPGEGATWTHIRVKDTAWGVEDDREDGEKVYDGTGTSWTHAPLQPNTTCYFRAWSRTLDHEDQELWSTAYDDAFASTGTGTALEQFDLVLAPGWHAVSIPLDLLGFDETERVFAGVRDIYCWNDGAYAVPENIVTGQGYMVAVEEEITISVLGLPKDEWTYNLSAGWNLIGSMWHEANVNVMDLGVTPSDFLRRDDLYYWNGASYDNPEVIEPGKAYWLAATAPCTVTATTP